MLTHLVCHHTLTYQFHHTLCAQLSEESGAASMTAGAAQCAEASAGSTLVAGITRFCRCANGIAQKSRTPSICIPVSPATAERVAAAGLAIGESFESTREYCCISFHLYANPFFFLAVI